MWKEYGDSLKHHLIGFYNEYTFQKEADPNLTMNEFVDSYIKNEIAVEEGMEGYFNELKEVNKRNGRVLKAIKSVKGKAYYKHLINYIKDAQMNEWCEFEIVKTPVGDEQKITEYGRSITREWVDQRSVGTEGDSFVGTICLKLKPGKFLKFSYSM